ncbi:hypothetical protein [Dialister micraerophilus]|uniref:Uncharacterized protein n=1 Tax=Dialister micraerophilus UPII 345-E TaxID=910314 RepID=E4LAC3_9FIRM|nr:hypothetical protein [Dialister micraerophilus]EFR42281.1 hypothetical protein HMPREF9220_0753 [Dialister micraerophilus UPII 345-E]
MSILLERAINELGVVKDYIIDEIEQDNITNIVEIAGEAMAGAYADKTLVYNAKTAEKELLEEYSLMKILKEINELDINIIDDTHIELLHVIMCENELIEYMEDLYKSIGSDNKDNLIELVELIAGDI